MHTYGLDIPDADLPCRKVETKQLRELKRKRADRLDALYLPPMSLTLAKRATVAHKAGYLALSVVALHLKLEKAETFRIRAAILERLGIGARTWRRYADALADAGFIRLTETAGRRSAVTIIDAELLKWLST